MTYEELHVQRTKQQQMTWGVGRCSDVRIHYKLLICYDLLQSSAQAGCLAADCSAGILIVKPVPYKLSQSVP